MKGKTLLVIDDHQDSCDAIKKMIERRNGEAECAATLKEGIVLERVRRETGRPFDAIVCDLAFPHSNAFETIETLKMFRSYGIPVRAITGASDPEIITACHEAGIALILKGTAAEGIMESLLYALAENADRDMPQIAEQIVENRNVSREIPAYHSPWFFVQWPRWGQVCAGVGSFLALCGTIVTMSAAVIKTIDAKAVAAEAARQVSERNKTQLDGNTREIGVSAQKIRLLEDDRVKVFTQLGNIEKQLDRMEDKIDKR
jgi:CheY-like chemotaxis protein